MDISDDVGVAEDSALLPSVYHYPYILDDLAALAQWHVDFYQGEMFC